MILLRIVMISLILIIGLKGKAQTKTSTSKIEKALEAPINSLAETFLEDTLMKSISIGVYYKGEVYTQHFGELDEGEKNIPSNKTIYEIGSVSKTFVGTLMAKAELDGKLSVEDDIRDYLEGDYPSLQYENHPIRIKHLLTHTSRLPQFLPVSIMDEFKVRSSDLADRISKLENSYSKRQFFEDLKNITIDTIPGVKYAYSNTGGELASFILEKAYGMPFEKLLQEKLFSKANMSSTGMKVPFGQNKRYANGYGDNNNIAPSMKTNLWGGSGHVKSTLPDLMNYIRYHLSEETEVQKSHEVLFDMEVIHGDPRIKLGYMWEKSTDEDFGQIIYHHGGAYSVQNWMMIYPEEGLGISVITNQSGRHTAGKLYNVVRGIQNEIADIKYTSDKSEEEQITETLMDYIEGSTKGQPKRLEKAFHPDLNVYYIWSREFRVWSGKTYIEDTIEGESTGETGKILSIDYENDIATAKIQISHPENESPYIDFLMLMKVNGDWVILHKMFTEQKVKK